MPGSDAQWRGSRNSGHGRSRLGPVDLPDACSAGRSNAGCADVAAVTAREARGTSLSDAAFDESAVRTGALIADETSALPASTSTLKHNEALLRLLSSPNLASKEWVYRQYDHMVRTNTVVLPGADAAVVRIKETRRALAIALGGNGRFFAANPRAGGKLGGAQTPRHLGRVGARTI